MTESSAISMLYKLKMHFDIIKYCKETEIRIKII